MIRNYLKIAWRSLLKNKMHSFINIAGLSVGMAIAILIGLWIFDELSYDTYHKNYGRIVQVMQHQTYNGETGTQTSLPMPLGTKLWQDYTEDFKYVVSSSQTEKHVIAAGDKKLVQLGNFMQPEAPDMLTLKMLEGSRAGLKEQSSILLSARLKKALFGNAEAINQLIKIDNKFNVKVTGVYEDLPRNTSFYDMSYISTWDLYLTTDPYFKTASTLWGNNSWEVYAQLRPNVDLNAVSARIKNLKYQGLAAQDDKIGLTFKPVIFLYPMSRWHLYAEFKNGVNTGGAIEFVWMFGIIGLFVLLLACINFMNLSTARSEKRAKEVGIRKTVGSLRSQLVWQFFSESLMVTFFGFLLSTVIVQLLLPWFNQVADKQLQVLWGSPAFWLLGTVFSIITGLVAGSYPAFYLSSFQPVKVLKGTFKAGRFAALPRMVLVVLQFTVSVTLIIGTIVVFRQVQYTKNRPVGYSRDGLIQAQMQTSEIHDHFSAVRNDLLRSGAIAEIAESGGPLTEIWGDHSGLEWRGKDPKTQDDFATEPVTTEFGKTVGWQIVDGRDFSREFLTDSSAMIVNESAIKFMNFKKPLGETVRWFKNFKIVGVVKDMVMESPYRPVQPMLFYLLDYKGSFIDIRINPKMGTSEALNKITAIFKQYDPDSPFDYHFTDAEYAKKFADEERIGKLAGFFTLLAIFISCMGLFGMASFMAEQRTKEIGVRKVLGATVFGLWGLLSKDFVKLVVISLLLAIPTAYYFMDNWLQHYNYRAELSWWIFAVTAAGAIVITLATVSYQSIRAALANPVGSFKSE